MVYEFSPVIDLLAGEEHSEGEILSRVQNYLDEGADNINAQDKDGNTALHIAVKRGFENVVKLLLGKCAWTHIKNKQGDTAITLTQKLGKREIAKILENWNQTQKSDDPGYETCSISSSLSRKSTAEIKTEEPAKKLRFSPANVDTSEPLAGTSTTLKSDDTGYETCSITSSSSRKSTADVKPTDLLKKQRFLPADVNPSKPLAGTSKTQRVGEPGSNFGSVASILSEKRPADNQIGESLKHPKLAADNEIQRTLHPDSVGTILGKGQRRDVNEGEITRDLHWDIKETYCSRGLKSSLYGVIYQLKLLMLILYRAFEMNYRFSLNTEMESAGKFDDLVIEYKDQKGSRIHQFVQFKHKLDVNKLITAKDLLTDDTGDFSMKKYFSSWHKIKRNETKFDGSGSKNFYLCTNIGLDVQGLEENGITPAIVTESNDLLRITTRKEQPPFYKLRVGEASVLWSKLKSVCNVNNIDHKEISHFLDEFVIAVNQSNEIEIGELIAQEFGAHSQFNLIKANLLKNSFQDKLLDWFKTKQGVSIVGENATMLFENVNREIRSTIVSGLPYPRKLELYNIKFKREIQGLRSFLDNSNSTEKLILELTSFEQTLLTTSRIYRTIQEMERYKAIDSFIIIELEKLLLPGIMNQVFREFQSTNSHNLLIIDFGLDSTRQDTSTLWTNIHQIMIKLNEKTITGKRIILVIPKKDVQVLKLKVAHQFIDEEESDVSIDKLTRSTQQKLLEKDVIKFQGREQQTNFARLLGTDNLDDVTGEKLEDYRRIVDQKRVVKLIRNEEIRIGGKVEGSGEVTDFYIPLTIGRRVVIKADILKDSDIPDIFVFGGVDENFLAKLPHNHAMKYIIWKKAGRSITSTRYARSIRTSTFIGWSLSQKNSSGSNLMGVSQIY